MRRSRQGPPALANAAGADGVHLTSAELKTLGARPDVAWCAASCHDAAELARAQALGVDFVVLGPVAPTPSHPGAPVLGWPRFAELLRDYPLPAYALGGMRAADRAVAHAHGAHGLAMLRGAWPA